VDRIGKKKPDDSGRPEAERRRIGVVVHDERGNASVAWHDAPVDEQRQVLEVLGEPQLTIKTEEESFDPYARSRGNSASGSTRTAPRKPTDLRKLSEWIKMMRQLEGRKRDDNDED
jgi:hypothetical protein